MHFYLMFDQKSILGGEYVAEFNSIGKHDLLLQSYPQGGFQVLRNGVNLVSQIQDLVVNHGYQVVLRSNHTEEEQIQRLRQLQVACAEKGIACFNVHAMSVYDPDLYPNTTSREPFIIERDAIRIAAWGADYLDGKASVRNALESLLPIEEQDRGEHIILEDGLANFNALRSVGYVRSFLIGDHVEEGCMRLDYTLSEMLAQQREFQLALEIILSNIGESAGDLRRSFRLFLLNESQIHQQMQGVISPEAFLLGLDEDARIHLIADFIELRQPLVHLIAEQGLFGSRQHSDDAEQPDSRPSSPELEIINSW